MPTNRTARISGTYVERLLTIWMPLAAVPFAVLILDHQLTDIPPILFVLSIMIFFWLADCLCLLTMNLKPLKVDDVVYIGGARLSPPEILRITPVIRRIGKMEYRIIEFTILNGSDTAKIAVIAKPVSIIGVLRGKKSKTFTLLFNRFPQLERKLRAEAMR